jgi:hypothetical protein
MKKTRIVTSFAASAAMRVCLSVGLYALTIPAVSIGQEAASSSDVKRIYVNSLGDDILWCDGTFTSPCSSTTDLSIPCDHYRLLHRWG